MTKYLLAYHGGKMAEGEAEQAKVVAAWGEWFASLGAAVVDGGAPSARRPRSPLTARRRAAAAPTR